MVTPSNLPAGRVSGRVLIAVPLALGLVIGLAAGASGSARPGAGQTAATALAGTWKLLPATPVIGRPDFAVSVWTGHEMIIHGSLPGVTFAYRPRTNTWAKLRPGPKGLSGLEASDVAVWTGSRMLVMGLTNGSYDPATNAWSPIARGAGPDELAVVAWTGHEAIIWDGVCCTSLSNGGTAYDPTTRTWQKLPAAPLQPRRDAMGAWDGSELIVAGGLTHGAVLGSPEYLRDAAAYNPAARTWRKLAPMPVSESGATAVWDGKEILFIGGQRAGASGPALQGLAYNPATNRWRWLPAMGYPRSGFAAVWTGRQLLIWGGLTANGVAPPYGEAYNPATNKWTALPASPLPGRADPLAVWTGHQMIVWGGSGYTDGAAYTPAR